MSKIKKYIIIMVILVIIVMYYLSNNVKYNNDNRVEDLKICFLDVGQGESIIIRYKENNILIDAGNNLDGEYLVNYFKEEKIDKFDLVFVTHPHEDHAGGMNEVINNFKIDRFFMPNIKLKTKTYYDIIDSINNKNLIQEVPKIGDTYNINDLKITVLSIGNDKLNVNDSAIVLKVAYKNNKFLLTSDVSKEIEYRIMNEFNIKSDVLKVSHHGSSNSSSAKFLKEVSPSYAVISVGLNNDYNEPKEVVLNKLERLNIKVLRTDIDHTICFYSNGNTINYKTINTNTNGGDLVIYEE